MQKLHFKIYSELFSELNYVFISQKMEGTLKFVGNLESFAVLSTFTGTTRQSVLLKNIFSEGVAKTLPKEARPKIVPTSWNFFSPKHWLVSEQYCPKQ